jgi:hypothetical protein
MTAARGEACSAAYFFISSFFSPVALGLDGDGALDDELDGELDGELEAPEPGELVAGLLPSSLPQAASATAAAAASISSLFMGSSSKRE